MTRKKAFRKLARKYYPDVSNEPDAEARMQAVNQAYAARSDPEKRAAYDLGQRLRTHPATAERVRRLLKLAPATPASLPGLACQDWPAAVRSPVLRRSR